MRELSASRDVQAEKFDQAKAKWAAEVQAEALQCKLVTGAFVRRCWDGWRRRDGD